MSAFWNAFNAILRSTPESIYRNGDRAFEWPGDEHGERVLEQENENENENEERE